MATDGDPISLPVEFALVNTKYPHHDLLHIIFGSLMFVGALACVCRCALGARKNMCLEVDMPLTDVRGGVDCTSRKARLAEQKRRIGIPMKKVQ